MFDYIQVENLDPRLITVSSNGKIETSLFADTLFLKGLLGQNNTFAKAVGDINFTSTDPLLSIIALSGSIQFSSSFERTKVSSVWCDGFYLNGDITIVSDKGFTPSAQGNDVFLAPNAVHSLGGKNSDLTLFGLGNVLLFTNTEQNSINLSLDVIDDTNIDPNSYIDAKAVVASQGISVSRDLIPEFLHFQQGAVQGLTGVVLLDSTIGQLTVANVALDSVNLFENAGQLVISGNTPSVSFSSGTQCSSVFMPASYSGSFSSFTHLFSGIYYQSVPLSKYPLSLEIDFSSNNTGFAQDFSTVLSYQERVYYTQQLTPLNSGISSKFINMMNNPDNLSGSTLTNYYAMLSDLMGNYIVLTNFGTPYSSLTGSIGLYPGKSGTYLPIVTGILSPSTVTILNSFVSDKLSLNSTNALLNLPSDLVYYYELQTPSGSTSPNLVLFLKSPTATPPTGTYKGLFAA